MMQLFRALLCLVLLMSPCTGANAKPTLTRPFDLTPQTTVCISAVIDPSFVAHAENLKAVGDGMSGLVQRLLFAHERKLATWIKYETFLPAADATLKDCQQALDILINISIQKRADGSAYRAVYSMVQGQRKDSGVYERDLKRLIETKEVFGGFGGDQATDLSQDLKGLVPLLQAKLKVVNP